MKKRKEFLPFALPLIETEELKGVEDTLRSGWITTGPKVKFFEREFASFVGARHAIAVNSCTAAMHLALGAIGLKPGDLVFTTPYTFAATAEVVRYFGAIPVFVDIDDETFNIDAQKLKKAVEEASRKSCKEGIPRAVIPVHIAGQSCDMAAIHGIARQYNLAVIEDAAHALPAKLEGVMIGAASDFTCFSFYATKTLTTGEGGMICTENDEWAEWCRMMSLHGISRDAWKRYTAEGSWYYEIIAPGFKYNMTDVAAAIGIPQLRKCESMWQRRADIAKYYTKEFQRLREVKVPYVCPGVQHAWHLYIIRLNLERLTCDRSQFVEQLREHNIGTSVHFIPLHLHPYYRQEYGFEPNDFPVALGVYERVISLPIYPGMSDEDVDDVVEAVRSVAEKNRR
jgi:dTDP-4-amino-4,6-dideoxygalactose transaminase